MAINKNAINNIPFYFADFRDSCFASTSCKVYKPEEGWSLSPFCGASKCVKLSRFSCRKYTYLFYIESISTMAIILFKI